LQYFIKNPEPIHVSNLLKKLNCTDGAIKALVKNGYVIEKMVEVYRDPYSDRHFERTKPLPLTPEQENAISPILDSIENVTHNVFLMYGVTGSGKTEVYMQAIDKVLKLGKEAIVLVPEIS